MPTQSLRVASIWKFQHSWFIEWFMKKTHHKRKYKECSEILQTQSMNMSNNNFNKECFWLESYKSSAYSLFNAKFNWIFCDSVNNDGFLHIERNLPLRTSYRIGSINQNWGFYSIQNTTSHEMCLKASSNPIEPFA